MATWKRVLTEADLGVAVNSQIGTDTDIDCGIDEHIDTIVVTDGVISSMSKQTMTARDIGGVATTGTLNDDEFLQWDDGANLIVKSLTKTEMQTALNVADGATANTGDITSVVAGTGMTGGATDGAATVNVIGGTGITANADDIAITNTAVTAGSYTFTALTVDAQGRITAASSGTDTGDVNEYSFKTIVVSGEDDVVADTTTDTLTLVASGGMTITTSADAITLSSANTDVSVSKDNLEATLALMDTNYTLGSGSGIDGTISGDLTITGDLYVTGTTTQVSTTELLVEDKTIQVASNADSLSGSTSSGIIVGASATTANCSSILWKSSQGGGNTDGAGAARGLTGWFVKNSQTSNQADYAVAIMSYKTDTGAPTANEAGVGSLLTNTFDDQLYIRLS